MYVNRRRASFRGLGDTATTAVAVVPSFSDVPADHAWFNAVEWMKARGISAGCETGKFCLERPATRGEVAVFLYRALGPGGSLAAGVGGGQAPAPVPDDPGGITVFGQKVSPLLAAGVGVVVLGLILRPR